MRVKGGPKTRRRHKKILKSVKGFRHARRRLYKVAKESYLHAGQYSFAGRRKRLSQMRSLWVTRLNAALRSRELSYSVFINLLRKNNLELSRKVLSEMAVTRPDLFDKLIEKVRS